MYRLFCLFVLLLIVSNCNSQSTKPIFIATNPPIAEIIKEIVGTRGDVISILPPGESPHTYQPKPSDMYLVNSAKAVFYVSDNLDGWALKLDAKNKIQLVNFLPKEQILYYENGHSGHSHEGEEHKETDSTKNEKQVIDPHFWTDPLAVQSILNSIADTLSKLDPDNAEIYRSNAETFKNRLTVLDKQLSNILNPVRGKPVFQFHPSFNYFLKRYNLFNAGAIEVSPGKEPSPRYLSELVKKIKSTGAKAIFGEPQLPEKSARIIAETADINLFTLDPLGGVPNRMTYSDMLIYNARTLKQALE